MKTNDNYGITFDAKSGISEEEQREILAKINNIAEKNRLSLMEEKSNRFKAKKSGGVFPVIVIIAAAAALAGGLTLLSSIQWKTDAQARTGSRVENSVERALIEEIRKETQSEAAAYAAANAANELERLNREQYMASSVEDQIGAFFANLNRQIADNRLDEAALTIKAMREFINTPAFTDLRSIQARKGLYIQVINSFETMIGETRQYKADGGSQGTGQLSDYQARIAQIEKDLEEKNKTIEALSSEGSGASRRLNELQRSNSALQTENRDLGRTNNTLQTRNSQLAADLEKQTQAAAKAESDLQTEKRETARLNQTVAARDNTISGNENTIRDLRRQNETQAQRINRIQEILQGKAAVNMTIAELSESITKIQEVMGGN